MPMPLFAQDQPPPPVEVHVAAPTIDFGAIGHSIVDALTQALPDLVGGIGQSAGSNMHSATGNLWNGLWTSGANVFTQTNPAQTINFGPIVGYTSEAQTAAYGLVLFGVMLLGLRTMLSSFVPMQSDTVGELVYGIATAMMLAGALPVLMLRAVDVLNLALRQLGGVNLSSSLPQSIGNDPIVTVVLALLVVWYGIKFVIKSMKRLVVLAVLTPFGPIAMLLRCIPQTRWVSGWWARTWGGLLVAQAPAALALTIGVQLALFSGVLGVLWTVAFLGAASDLLDLFGHGMIGGSGPGLVATGMTAARLATGWAAASSMGGAAAAYSTPSRYDEQYGYD
jgi:hypothetical protein